MVPADDDVIAWRHLSQPTLDEGRTRVAHASDQMFYLGVNLIIGAVANRRYRLWRAAITESRR